MASSEIDLDLEYMPRFGGKLDYGIGALGAGFIMRDVHLVAYREAGYNVVAVASRTPANALAAARQNGIEHVHDDWRELLADPAVEIVDIASRPISNSTSCARQCATPGGSRASWRKSRWQSAWTLLPR